MLSIAVYSVAIAVGRRGMMHGCVLKRGGVAVVAAIVSRIEKHFRLGVPL